jgi:hypothetical protein
MSFIYLGSPYSYHHPIVVMDRFNRTERLVAQLLKRNYHIYSPIVHCHELAHKYDLPKDAMFWQSYNYAMLAKASQLWVYRLPGWEESTGLTAERLLANKLSIPTQFVDLIEDLKDLFQ